MKKRYKFLLYFIGAIIGLVTLSNCTSEEEDTYATRHKRIVPEKDIRVEGIEGLPNYSVEQYINGEAMEAADGGAINCTTPKCYKVIFDVYANTPEAIELEKKLDTPNPDVVPTVCAAMVSGTDKRQKHQFVRMENTLWLLSVRSLK
jgi:hypothetical protein